MQFISVPNKLNFINSIIHYYISREFKSYCNLKYVIINYKFIGPTTLKYHHEKIEQLTYRYEYSKQSKLMSSFSGTVAPPICVVVHLVEWWWGGNAFTVGHLAAGSMRYGGRVGTGESGRPHIASVGLLPFICWWCALWSDVPRGHHALSSGE